jgi:hypothetical protein
MLVYACDKCRTNLGALLNMYGVLLCRDCWTEYINTDEGKVEYLVDIAEGDYSADLFDADFLGHAVVQWNKNKSQFDISDKEIEEYEIKLKQLGLL